jgi:NADP-dependent 3-hydroxy acid dehydrogenase YdfG
VGPDRLQALALELGLGEAAALRTDVTDAGHARALVPRVDEVQSDLDAMINTAGLMPRSPLAILFRPTNQE